MDLTTPQSEFAHRWVVEALAVQPTTGPESFSLTWYEKAGVIYARYLTAAQIHQCIPLSFNDLWVVLKLTIPSIRTGRMFGEPVYAGLRLADAPR